MASKISFQGNNDGLEVGINQGNITFTSINNDADQICMQALRCPNSRAIRHRLTREKDQLRPTLIQWIINSSQYRAWRDGREIGLLWIKGGAGKGKTMMTIFIIDQLSRLFDDSSSKESPLVTYFFCQNTDDELSSIAAIIKGLILQLVHQEEAVARCLRNYWDINKRTFTHDMSSWRILWNLFWEMLDRCERSQIYIIIDGLDECKDDDVDSFLRMVVRNGLDHPGKIKWLLASRPLDSAERELLTGNDQAQVSLELNHESVTESVRAYVHEKVKELDRRARYNKSLRQEIESKLVSKAEGTFLWVSLVCKQLESVRSEDALGAIQALPSGLPSLYHRVFSQLQVGSPTDVKGSMILLKIMNSTCGPQTSVDPWKLEALASICGLVGKYSSIEENETTVKALVDRCASFLQMHERTVRFSHQSARDFFVSDAGKSLLDSQEQFGQYELAMGYVSFLDRHLKVNLLDFSGPDSSPHEVDLTEAQTTLLRNVAHAATHWLGHFNNAEKTWSKHDKPIEKGVFKSFVQTRFLEWIECLSFSNSLADDESGFYTTMKPLVWPTQWKARVDVIIMHPVEQLMKEIPRMPEHWAPHGFGPFAFAIDGRLPFVNFDDDLVLKPLHNQTRDQRKTLGSRSGPYSIVTWSPDNGLIASAAMDSTIKVWNAITGQIKLEIPHNAESVNAIAITNDAAKIAWSSDKDSVIRLWDSASQQIKILTGHTSSVCSLSFSPNDRQLVSGSVDHTARLWDTATGSHLKTLSGHSDRVGVVTFSPGGHYVASGSDDKTVRLWDTTRGGHIKTLQPLGIMVEVKGVSFSTDGKWIAACSSPTGIQFWELAKSLNPSKLFWHSLSRYRVAYPDREIRTPFKVRAIQFSPDDRYLATNMRPIWLRGITRSGVPVEPGLRYEQGWVCSGDLRILYLPENALALTCDVEGDQVRIGFPDGFIVSFGINLESLARQTFMIR
ncbi:uncharacterized protein N7506_009252 [Penicillium brevicompactum]|uniref:uncharacterized protein n=1 Tax=Penicillium brevicompactum TaxID=5074 RepID=UPI002541D464|nr:uncharacterized protein N7506_009252 [Penicillium brevicompactum]KAJ5326150.1 hypothetical protein N7506_009252 [Penicillium brevicompactum]